MYNFKFWCWRTVQVDGEVASASSSSTAASSWPEFKPGNRVVAKRDLLESQVYQALTLDM